MPTTTNPYQSHIINRLFRLAMYLGIAWFVVIAFMVLGYAILSIFGLIDPTQPPDEILKDTIST